MSDRTDSLVSASSSQSSPATQGTANDDSVRLLEVIERQSAWIRSIAWLLGVVLICLLMLGIVGLWTIDHASRNAEDANWRESLIALSERPDPTGGVLSVTMLRSFLRSERHRDDASLAGRLLLPQLGSRAAFNQLFDSLYQQATVGNIGELLEIGREISAIYTESTISAYRLERQQKENKSNLSSSQQEIDRLDRQPNVAVDEASIVCNKLGELLRRPRPVNPRTLDMSSMLLYKCDLSGADLSHSKLDSATIQDTDVSGAILVDISGFGSTNFYNTEWWKAKEVSPDLLTFLKDHAYPYHQGDVYGSKAPNKEDYFSNLERLCKLASLDCTSKPAKFP